MHTNEMTQVLDKIYRAVGHIIAITATLQIFVQIFFLIPFGNFLKCDSQVTNYLPESQHGTTPLTTVSEFD